MTTYIETKTDLKEAILRELKRGKPNALPGRILAQRFGFKDDRRIRLANRDLRAERFPVAASGNGYFIADSGDEATEYMKVLKGRLVEDAYRLRDFKISARVILHPRQLTMSIGR